MKAKVRIEKEVEIKSILINVALRHIGDEDDDDVPTDMPMLNGTNWQATVDIDTGLISDWPIGEERELFAKVCDAGTYTLYDDEAEELAEIDGYVPHGVVPGEYGDYINLKINEHGVIKNWPSSPCVDEFFESDD